MNDAERIERMFENGVLTRAEADRLLAAIGASASRHAAGPLHPILVVTASLGNIHITVEPGLRVPFVPGYSVTQTETGATVALTSGDVFTDITEPARGDAIQVQLPAGWAVDLQVGAGSVRIHGPVQGVSGRVRAGEVRIEETAALNFALGAGDVRAGLQPTSGDHRLNVGLGSAKVTLLAGTHADVAATAMVGSVHARGVLHVTNGIGANARGLVGAGHHTPATVQLHVKTGDIRVGYEGN